MLLSGGRLERDCIVTVSSTSEIVGVECGVSDLDSRAGVEYYNGILVPGMVNAHCHLELSFFEGQIPQGTGLVTFIKNVVGRRGDFDADTIARAVAMQDKLMWSRGIQAVGDISNDDSSFAAKRGSDITYYTYAEYFGMPKVSDQESVYAHDTRHVEVGRELGIRVTPTPHSTYLVSEGLFGKATEVQGVVGPRLSIHFMETPSELGLFERQGGMYDFIVESGMEPDFLHHGSHAQRLVDCLPSDVPLLLIHNTQIRRQDVELIMSYFTDVTFALCPLSNYYIERGFPPAVMLREMGCRVALGTDSLSSNTTLDMGREVGWLWEHNPELPLGTILEWATAGGARALGMSDSIGTFDVGKKPGVVLLEGVDLARMTPTVNITAKRLV